MKSGGTSEISGSAARDCHAPCADLSNIDLSDHRQLLELTCYLWDVPRCSTWGDKPRDGRREYLQALQVPARERPPLPRSAASFPAALDVERRDETETSGGIRNGYYTSARSRSSWERFAETGGPALSFCSQSILLFMTPPLTTAKLRHPSITYSATHFPPAPARQFPVKQHGLRVSRTGRNAAHCLNSPRGGEGILLELNVHLLIIPVALNCL